jgi:hypothetical protein
MKRMECLSFSKNSSNIDVQAKRRLNSSKHGRMRAHTDPHVLIATRASSGKSEAIVRSDA